ncbi:trypsin-like serine peptidase [Micromonospora sp. LOL_025]|uniref:trypsin-like serine peptidase n=1 Tax=Micromonospora sp. LOL_025 TaxID=3345413 RepID=UPI003A8AEA8B
MVRPGTAPKAGAEALRAKAETAPTATADAVPPDNWVPRPSSSPSISPLAVSVSQRVSNTYVQPQSAVGRIFFSNQAETEFYTCSGTSITSTTRNAVWTAAHCLHQGSGGEAGWFANHVFIPAYSNGSDPFGWYFGLSIIASNDWINGGDLKDSDMGAMIVVPEDGLDLQGRVGGWGYTFGGGTAFTNARSYGYPVIGYNRPDSDFAEGEYMMFCEGNIVDAANLNPLDDRLRMNCDMGGGASGGPMATGVGTSGGPRIVGVNSHRNVDSNGNYNNNYLFSANHGSTAVSIINAVNS